MSKSNKKAILIIVGCLVLFAIGSGGNALSTESTTPAPEVTEEQPAESTEATEEEPAEKEEKAAEEPAEKKSESTPSTTTTKPSTSTSEKSTSTSSVKKGGSFWYTSIDVGQGTSVLVQCDGEYALFDGGKASYSSTVYSVLKKKGVKKLKYIFCSHNDADHCGGLAGALNYSKVGAFYDSDTTGTSKTWKNTAKAAAAQGLTIKVPKVPSTYKLGSATIKIVSPMTDFGDKNSNSLVEKITYGSTSFLITGDMSSETEADLISRGVDLNVDVLEVAHHGSKSATTTRLLKAASPKTAIISCGKGNSYGHPHSATLKRLKAQGCSIYRTDLQGDITITSNGKKLTYSTERSASSSALWTAGSNS